MGRTEGQAGADVAVASPDSRPGSPANPCFRPDEGSDAAPPPLAPSRRRAGAVFRGSGRDARKTPRAGDRVRRGWARLAGTRVFSGLCHSRGQRPPRVFLSLFGYYEPTAAAGPAGPGRPRGAQAEVRDLDNELVGSGGGAGTFLACAHAAQETITEAPARLRRGLGGVVGRREPGELPAAVEEFLARTQARRRSERSGGRPRGGVDRPPPPAAPGPARVQPSPGPGPGPRLLLPLLRLPVGRELPKRTRP